MTTCIREKRGGIKYKRGTDIESLNPNDPKTFCREINNLGPRVGQAIPMSVSRTDGTIRVDTKVVLNGWKIFIGSCPKWEF